MRRTTIGIDYSEEGVRRADLIERLLVAPPSHDVLMALEPQTLQQQINDIWYTLSDEQRIAMQFMFMLNAQINRAEQVRLNVALLALEIERKLEILKKD